jgi:hypothetical protein
MSVAVASSPLGAESPVLLGASSVSVASGVIDASGGEPTEASGAPDALQTLDPPLVTQTRGVSQSPALPAELG